jgi:hypothetical protein
MPAEYPAVHLFTGNPIRTQGYGFIAGSEGARSWAPHCLARATLGGASEAPNIWRAASDFEGIGTVWIGDALCVTRLQQLRGDQHLAELRQHILISANAAFDLSGDLSPIRAQFRPFRDYADLQPLLNSNLSLPEMRIAASDRQSIQAAAYHALARWFPDERVESLPALLQSLFDQKGAVCVVGLPHETAKRLDFALALMALLPPPLRFACTFATRIISSRGCFAHFKFLWEDHQQPEPNERLFDYADGTFAIDTEIAPYFRHALQAYREGERAFAEFGERYRQRAIELQRFNLQRFNLDAIKAAFYSILALDEWIEQDKNPSAARLFSLVNKDKSLPEPDLPKLYEEGLRLALRAYTPSTPFDSETIKQSATALARPALAEVALQWLKGTGVPEQPEATFKLCRAWWDIPEAKGILQDAAWQAVAREAAQAHLKELWKRSDHKRAHQFFNQLYRESAERTGFVLDEQTASNLLQIQERAIRQHGGDVDDVLETLRLSAAVRSVATLDTLLDANWMRAVPPELATALTAGDDRGNLGRAVKAYFRTNALTVFYKLALVCLKRKIFQPLLTEESLTLLLSSRPSPSERSLTQFYALSQLAREHYPEVGYAALNELADQPSLLRAISEPYWMLTAWLIANEDRRAVPLIQHGISNAQNTREFVKHLLSAYEPYRQEKLPQLWKALSDAKPVIQDAAPDERADFALLIELQDEEWRKVPSAVSLLASGLSTWQEPPNALERALQEAERLSSLETWYQGLLVEYHMHESVQANAKRVFGRYLRATAAALSAEKPEIERAAQYASLLLRLAPPRSLFGQWVMDELVGVLSSTQDERRRSKVRGAFIKLLKQQGFTDVSDLLLESSLRRQLLPAGLTPEQFLAQLDTTIRTLGQLVLWQNELGEHSEVARRVLNQWLEREHKLPADSQLATYFEAYDKTLKSIRELIEAGQRDGQRPLRSRKRQLEALRSGEREPNSAFGLLLRWISRLAPPRNSSES